MTASIVVNEIPGNPSKALEYLEHLLSLPGTEEVVFVPIVDRSDFADFDGYSGTLSALKEKGLKVVEYFGLSNNAMRLNVGVSMANSENVIVLERVFWLDESFVNEVNSALDERGVAAVLPLCFETSFGLSNQLRDAGEQAIPIDQFSPGKLLAIKRSEFLLFRGFDESPALSKLLSLDLLWRLRSYGRGVRSINSARAYTEESTVSYCERIGISQERREVSEMIRGNKQIFRNLVNWSVPVEYRVPLVSVAIATKDRSDLLVESLNSVLYQSFQDFEIIVVDDGSEDREAVRLAVESVNDPRITLKQKDRSEGVSSARNTAAELSQCELTAVHDDDDIMLPNRLELGISAITGQTDASYGSWINFDHSTGELRAFLTQTDFDGNLIAFSGAGPGHSTWTLPTKLIKQFRYNPVLTSSVDHELAARLVNAGVRWKHTNEFMYLRRVHELQITAQDTNNQKSGHTLSKLANRFLTTSCGLEEMRRLGSEKKYPSPKGANDLFKNFGGYLPDHLVKRDILVRGNTADRLLKADVPAQNASIILERDLLSGKPLLEQSVISGVSQEQLVQFAASGVGKFTIEPLLATTEPTTDTHSIEEVEELSLRKAESRAMARVSVAFGAVRRLKSDSHLVVDWNAPYSVSDAVPAGIPAPFFARRTEIVEEFGIKRRVVTYGYATLKDALKCLEELSKGRELSGGRTVFLYREEDAVLVASEYADMCERDFIKASIDDSGLYGEN